MLDTYEPGEVDGWGIHNEGDQGITIKVSPRLTNAGTFAAKRSSHTTRLGCAARQSPAKRRSRWPRKQASAICPTF